MQKTKYKNLKYRKFFHNQECTICHQTETTCGHHLQGKLFDQYQIPLCYNHHTGAQGIHTIGKITWYSKYLNQEDCYQLAEEWFNKFLDK